MHRIAEGWDAVELWIAGLPFAPQLLVVLLVVLPVSYGIARALDATLMAVLRVLGRAVHEQAPERNDGLG